jgi:hypothetical protein
MPFKPRPRCANCGEFADRSVNKYCSNKRRIDFQHQQWVRDWLEGRKDGLKSGIEISEHSRPLFVQKKIK